MSSVYDHLTCNKARGDWCRVSCDLICIRYVHHFLLCSQHFNARFLFILYRDYLPHFVYFMEIREIE